jgi:hypothetical protein
VSDQVCEYARSIAHRYPTVAALTAAVNAAQGTALTEGGLRNRYRRWRAKSGAPALLVMLGAGPASDFEDEETQPGAVPPAQYSLDQLIARDGMRMLHEAVDADLAHRFQRIEPGSVPHGNAQRDPKPDNASDEDEVKLPSGQRPSQLPPDHIIRIEPPSSGYVLITSDHHYPIHDQAAEAAVLALAHDIKPKVWVGNGDLLDAWWISRHEKEAERLVDSDAGVRIIDEVNAFRPFMTEMGSIVERGYLGMGNHENRLGALINANPGLHGLPGLRWKSIFDAPANCQVLDYGYRLQMGPVSMVHGDRIGGRFGVKHPTAWCLENQGARSVIFGHTHRMATTFRTTWEDTGPRQVVAINSGHLSDTSKQRYVVEPNWQHGVVVLDFWTEAGRPRYTPHLVPIVNGVLRFAGRTYR